MLIRCRTSARLCIFAASTLLAFLRSARAEDSTFLYAVQISAVVQTSPASITLNWEPDLYTVDSLTLYRKAKTDTDWGTGTALDPESTSYTDNAVAVGSAYEYQIVKQAHAIDISYTGYGYIYAGINAPLTESRGKLVLVVATNSTIGLDVELARLQSDLTGDGWQVLRHDVSSNDTPASVRNLIIADYNADPANVTAAFLFGHVPILQSGNLNYDGHEARPMPADAYYADIDGNWSSSPDYLPSDVELMLGRVDLFNMPGVGATTPWPGETELLRNYLNKDHNWRHNLIAVQRRALMGNLRGDEDGEATATSGYRNFEPMVGPGNTIEANVETGTNIPPSERWVSMLGAGTYLWAYGCGAGQPTACSGLGTNDGSFFDVWSTDMVGQDAHAVFVMIFGSWFGEWDYQDDLLRSVLATPTTGLTACIAGRPHWFLHHMALGEPIGYSTRLTMNNSTLYQNEVNSLTRSIYIALMGDPTLRLDPVGPPGAVTASTNGSAVNLSWLPSSDSIMGYYVYRASSPTGPFTRLTGSLLSGTSFADANPPPSATTYMVRAIKLQTGFSGSYYNPSQGVFATVNVALGAPAIVVRASRNGKSVALTWNSQSGTIYHVQSKPSLGANWSNLSDPIAANNSTTTWTDYNPSPPQRFYRITSP
jgi:hypothetical protein